MPTLVGSLIVVGTGIEAVAHVTLAAEGAIRNSDIVLYLVADPLTEDWIRELNPAAENLHGLYADGKDRILTYGLMIERILREVRAGRLVCAAFYGHPGVFVHPSHEAIRVAREEGHSARMLPGISAEDCLFADLGLDPSVRGCQSFEATDFLIRRRQIDVNIPMVLWQVGVVGKLDYQARGYGPGNFRILIEALVRLYGPMHEVTLYEASLFSGLPPLIKKRTLESLVADPPSAIATMYIPGKADPELDLEMVNQLGIDWERAKGLTQKSIDSYALKQSVE